MAKVRVGSLVRGFFHSVPTSVPPAEGNGCNDMDCSWLSILHAEGAQ